MFLHCKTHQKNNQLTTKHQGTMSKYQTNVYPFRHDANAFVNALLQGLPEYDENVEVGNPGRRPGSGNLRPSDMDRRRVRALLDSWNRNISHTYLDYSIVRSLDRASDIRRPNETVIQQAERLRASGGLQRALKVADTRLRSRALRSVSTELPADQVVDSVRNNPTTDYKHMYSAILGWCDDHCYGLPNHISNYINRTNGAGGGESALPVIYQASWRYIVQEFNARAGVYGRYFLPRTLMDYISPV